MVKNLKGGTGTKGLARKHQKTNNNGHVRVPECDGEVFAYVSSMLGNGMCEIYLNSKDRLIGHIRNKFRGRQKRHNTIMRGMIVLVGLREWENPAKNCDILTIYEDNDIKQLKNNPNIKIQDALDLQLANTIGTSNAKYAGDDLIFDNNYEDDNEYQNNIKPKNAEEFVLNYKENIDLDDI